MLDSLRSDFEPDLESDIFQWFRRDTRVSLEKWERETWWFMVLNQKMLFSYTHDNTLLYYTYIIIIFTYIYFEILIKSVKLSLSLIIVLSVFSFQVWPFKIIIVCFCPQIKIILTGQLEDKFRDFISVIGSFLSMKAFMVLYAVLGMVKYGDG